MASRKAGLISAKRGLALVGLEEVTGNLAKVLNGVTGGQAKTVFTAAAVEVRDTIRDLAPVKTGALKRGIFAARGDENLPNALVGVNYGIAPHAHLVEFGTVKSAPHPYFRPGLVAAAPKAKRIMEDGLRKIVEEATK